MNLSRLKTLTVCLGVAFLMLAGTALAGTTATTVVNFAREVGAANAIYTIPTNTATRKMDVLRGTGQNFFVDAILDGGALWDSTGPPVAGSLSFGGTETPATYAVSLVGSPAGLATATWLVTVTGGAPTGFPTGTITATGLKVKDVANVLGPGGTINLTIRTRESDTGNVVDSGTDQKSWLVGKNGVSTTTIVSTTAIVDVATNRLNFVATPPDALKEDNGATLTLTYSTSGSGVKDRSGATFALITGDTIDLVITGNLSGITAIAYDAFVYGVTSTNVTDSSATIAVPFSSFGGNVGAGAKGISIRVDGTTTLSTRTLNVAVNLTLTAGTGVANSGVGALNNRTLVSATTLTVWSLNGTILVANLQNGNNQAFSGRTYLWNPSTSAGAVTAQVYTLPLVGGGASTLLGTVSLGTLAATSGVNIKTAEDILTPLGIPLPYTANGGNVVVVFTVQAVNVRGISQVFSAGFAFGTYPLQIIP